MKRQLALSLCCALAAGCGTSMTGDGAKVHDTALSPVNWGQCCPSVPVQPPVVQPPAVEPPVGEPSAAPTEDPGPPATTTMVTVRNFEFEPSQITVAPGTTVTWKFEGPAQHTSTSDAGSAMTWDSGLKSPGESFSLTFNEKGTFSYHCTPHPQMKGTVIVEDSADGGGGGDETGPEDGGEDTGGTDGGNDTGSTGGSGY
jgi:plastocyanin